jgi:hypothetical protein
MQTLQIWCTLESAKESACHWLLEVVDGPAHCPRADVVEPAASARLSVLIAFSQRKELPLAASERRRNGAVGGESRSGSWPIWTEGTWEPDAP